MKKKFKKVVEWDEEPNIRNITLGIYLFLTAVFFTTFINFNVEGISNGWLFFVCLYITLSYFGGICLVIFGMGNGRKVRYVEVRE